MGPGKRRRRKDRDAWGDHGLRTMLNAVMIISFLCLLRIDEALRIEWHWLKLEQHEGNIRLVLRLPYRKTHQSGGS